MNGGRDEEEKGLLWNLPAIKSNKLGKLGPAFGVGAGCGVGFAVGLVGGEVPDSVQGIPGLQLGFGFGAGCGVGVGFGYGVGRGIAYDENRQYSNVGKVAHAQDEIGALVDELVLNTKRLIKATSREVDKWRRH